VSPREEPLPALTNGSGLAAEEQQQEAVVA